MSFDKSASYLPNSQICNIAESNLVTLKGRVLKIFGKKPTFPVRDIENLLNTTHATITSRYAGLHSNQLGTQSSIYEPVPREMGA